MIINITQENACLSGRQDYNFMRARLTRIVGQVTYDALK